MLYVSKYLAEFDKLANPVLGKDDALKKEEYITNIKVYFGIVLGFLKAIQHRLGMSTTYESIQKLENYYDMIIHQETLTKEMLKEILQELTAVVSHWFISPLLRTLPTKEDLLYGSHVELGDILKVVKKKKQNEVSES